MTAQPPVQIRDTPEGAMFEVHVHPRAKRTMITGVLGGRVKLAVASPPADGRANQELMRFFANLFEVPRRAVVLLAGESARDKRILIAGRTAIAVSAVIDQALAALKSSVG